jgi:hypothetical protein
LVVLLLEVVVVLLPLVGGGRWARGLRVVVLAWGVAKRRF